MVEARLREVEGVAEVTVKLVWEPTWTQDRMTEAARLQLGLL
jgi:metal-sulfur cluster biosynthetic enzyme